jgi:GNAT superfamily N-acetyltransferase
VPPSALQRSGVVVTPHAELDDYPGVWFFVRGDSAVVSAPSEWVARLEDECGSSAAEELLSPASASRVLGPAAGQIVGPSFQGWLPTEYFRPIASDGVRRLAESEAEYIRAFRASCSHEEWEHGGIDPVRADVWASFQGAQVVALAQLRSRPGNAVDPSIITHPEHRGRGHGLRLVSSLVERALAAEQLVLYQALMSNAPSISLARHLGFDHYATLLAVRLVSDAAPPQA